MPSYGHERFGGESSLWLATFAFNCPIHSTFLREEQFPTLHRHLSAWVSSQITLPAAPPRSPNRRSRISNHLHSLAHNATAPRPTANCTKLRSRQPSRHKADGRACYECSYYTGLLLNKLMVVDVVFTAFALGNTDRYWPPDSPHSFGRPKSRNAD